MNPCYVNRESRMHRMPMLKLIWVMIVSLLVQFMRKHWMLTHLDLTLCTRIFSVDPHLGTVRKPIRHDW